ncbi:MAG TPA: hypothetical protein PK413_01550 [Thermoanaerobaculia bacterium]|nr:hypothetical protein [Thermoanaerobaculia bacterium]
MKRSKMWLMLAVVCGLFVLPAAKAETFIQSDDYKDDDEVVGKFLKDEDYRLMIKDIERNGAEFDWGWVKTKGKVKKPKNFDFDLSSYKTITIPKVQNFAGILGKEFPEAVRDYFKEAAETVGLNVSEKGNLELDIAIVDAKKDSTYIYFAYVQPFIELEIRLKDRSTGESLVLLRNQEHGSGIDDAAQQSASEFAKFMR